MTSSIDFKNSFLFDPFILDRLKNFYDYTDDFTQNVHLYTQCRHFYTFFFSQLTILTKVLRMTWILVKRKKSKPKEEPTKRS